MRTVAPEAQIDIGRAARRQPGNRKQTVFDKLIEKPVLREMHRIVAIADWIGAASLAR